MKHKNNWSKLKGTNVLSLSSIMISKFEKENNNATGQTKKANKEK